MGWKQQLAAVRMLFDWLIIGQVVPANPASAVRGPKHVVKTGKAPVLDAADWRKLLDAIPTDTIRDLRDESIGRLAHDPPARGRRRHSRADRQSHIPRHGDHRLSCQWRRAGACPSSEFLGQAVD
jgi:hypothetical protein